MAFIPNRVTSSGNPQFESKENIKPDFFIEWEARFRQMERYNANQYVINGVGSNFSKLTDNKMLTPEEANLEWGIDGALQFQEPIRAGEAKRRSVRITRDREVEEFVARASQNESLLGKVGNLGIALASMATDVTNYIPVGGQIFKGLRAVKLARAGSLTAKVLRSPVGVGMVDAAGGTLLAQPMIYANHQDLALDYGIDDALLDVGLAGVFGAGIGTIGSMVRTRAIRGKRAARMADYSERMVRATKDVDAAQVAMGTQLTDEARVNLTNYLTAANKDGGAPDPDIIRAILKTSNAAEDLTPNNSSIFLNDLPGKVNLDDFNNPATRRIIDRAGTSPLIPESFVTDIDSAFAATAAKQTDSLPPLTRALAKDLGSIEGKITIENFIGKLRDSNALPEELLSNDKLFRKEIANFLGQQRVKSTDKLTAKQVFALAEELEARKLAAKEIDGDSLVGDLKDFQQGLNSAKKNIDVDLNTYKSRFEALRDFLAKNPEYRNLTVSDLKGLSPQVRNKILDFMNFFKEANPTESQLAKALRGDKDILDELYQQMKLNSIKNSISEEDALKLLSEKMSRGNFAQEVDISPAARLGHEKIKTADDGLTSTDFINEEVESLKNTFDEKELTAIETDVKQFTEKQEKRIKGTKRSIDCVFGA